MNTEIIDNLRNAQGISLLYTSESNKITKADLYRLIASVEEANAVCEGIILRSPPEFSLVDLGFFAFSDSIREGEAFAGMWSDIRKGKPQHPAAFARLISERKG